MLPQNIIFSLCAVFMGVHGAPTSLQATDPCPTDTEYACFDVINSSLCLSQNASRNGTAAQMAACVDYPGGMSDLPGASKVRRSGIIVGIQTERIDHLPVMPLSRLPLRLHQRGYLKTVSSTMFIVVFRKLRMGFKV